MARWTARVRPIPQMFLPLLLLLAPRQHRVARHALSCLLVAAPLDADNAATWGEASSTLLEQVAALDRPCTIHTVNGSLPRDLDAVSEPTLVRPSASDWPQGVRAWIDRDAFLRRHGDVRVEPRTSLGTAQTGPRRRTNTATTPPGCTLASMLAPSESSRVGSDSLRQVFQAASLRPNETALGTCDKPEPSREWLHAMEDDLGPMLSWMGPADGRILSISESGAGLPRHSHGAAWLASIVGSKFWILHPPVSEGGSVEWAALPFSAAQWLARLGSSSGRNLQQSVQWCVQQPGDVMVLPAFWHHATVNVGDAIAVGAQRNILHWEQAAKTVSAMGQHVDSSRNARLLELTADSVLQLSAQAGKSTGQESVRNMNRVEAASLLEQACVAEPLNIRLRIKTARILASVARIDRAWEQLENASTTLSWLETTIGSITGADAAAVGGQIGVAVMTLMKERSEFALPLLERAVAADRLIACDTNAGRDVDLVFYLAYAHGRKGRREHAVRLLKEVLAIEPDHTDATKMLALLQR